MSASRFASESSRELRLANAPAQRREAKVANLTTPRELGQLQLYTAREFEAI